MTYVVMGASGQTGGAVARLLIENGHRVRVVVRSAERGAVWSARGAEVAVASADDGKALATAFADAEGVYVLNPPYYVGGDPYARAQIVSDAILGALKDAKPRRVVALSSLGGGRSGGTGVIATAHTLETTLQALPLPVAILRASYFAENVASVLPVAKTNGVLPSFLPLNLALPVIATADIGALAVELLLSQWDGKPVHALIGPQDKSPRDMAADIASLLGRSVEPLEVPREAWVATLQQGGFGPEGAQAFSDMIDGIIAGNVSVENEILHTGITRFETVARALLG